jgi:5-methylcytosine-specific restriction enzyme subunit McrC
VNEQPTQLALEPIREWQTRTEALPSAVQAALLTHASKAIAIAANPEAGKVDLSANHHIGSISLPEVKLLIRPKVVSLESLFHLLEPSGSALKLHREYFGYKADQELLPAFATFVTGVIERSTGRGLYRAYRQEQDRLLALRGRIDLRRHLATGVDTPVACQFDEFTPDVIENQILLAAITRLLRLPDVAPATRALLGKQLARMEQVSLVRVDLASIDRVRFTRLNQHYEPAIRLARLVLESTSISDQVGNAQASVFLLDMNKVFEEFLEHQLRRLLSGTLDVSGQHRSNLDTDNQVTIKPDLLFLRRNRPVFVGDAKYKRTWDGTGPESDVYQVLAYATAFGVDEGVLVYAKEGDATRREIKVRNTDKTIWTWPLDLGGTPSDIDRSLQELASWIVERHRRAPTVTRALRAV